jgi:hypothetical protein
MVAAENNTLVKRLMRGRREDVRQQPAVVAPAVVAAPGGGQPGRQAVVRRPAEQLQPVDPAGGQQHGQDHRQDGAQALPAC